MLGFRRHLTYANVMATLAVFIALGSGAYAISKLPKNSVKSRTIAPGAVKASDIASGAVTPIKLRPDPAAVAPLGFANFEAGTLVEARSQNVTAANVQVTPPNPLLGSQFCFHNLPFEPKIAVGSLGFDVFQPRTRSDSIEAQAGTFQGCGGGDARVVVLDETGYWITRANFTVVFY